MKKQWAFLKAPRFWALVMGAVALALSQQGIINEAWLICVTTITGGFITIRTVDRFSDKKE